MFGLALAMPPWDTNDDCRCRDPPRGLADDYLTRCPCSEDYFLDFGFARKMLPVTQNITNRAALGAGSQHDGSLLQMLQRLSVGHSLASATASYGVLFRPVRIAPESFIALIGTVWRVLVEPRPAKRASLPACTSSTPKAKTSARAQKMAFLMSLVQLGHYNYCE